jgi:tetratricopeptide (TPR) repeat protein
MLRLLTASLLVLSDPVLKPPIRSESPLYTPQGDSAEDFYERGLIEIKKKRFAEARKNLEIALEKDGSFLNAELQLGFLDLWEGNASGAFQRFSRVLDESPCQSEALIGFQELGEVWRREEKKLAQILKIYQTLNECQPNNPDTLFYLGRALLRTGDLEGARSSFEKCLALIPSYGDAEILLGYIYLREKKWAEARVLFLKHEQNLDAKMGLALLARRTGDGKKAKKYLREVIDENPGHKEAKKEYAKQLLSDHEYQGAAAEFQWLVNDDPNEGSYWIDLFDLKSKANFAVFLETLYTDAKENDPSLGVPVVKDYYFFNSVHCLIPLAKRWRLDLEQMYYHQRENDILFPYGVNYSAYEAGGQATASYFFAVDWRLDLTARAFNAWGAKDVFYPFQSTTRFEPGSGLLYNSEKQLFSFDVHTESFIIKDFSKFISQLLRIDSATAGYAYRPDCKLRPEFEGWLSYGFIRDSLKNRKNTEVAVARLGVPFMGKAITAIYRFEHGHFDQLSQNYYSFKQQLRNVLGGRLRIDFSDSVFWETYFYHRWQTTYNLFQPIGDFVFIAAKQYLVANWVTSSVTARYKDKMRLVLEGRYYRDTLIYRDWNITGSFLWQF